VFVTGKFFQPSSLDQDIVKFASS